MMSRMNGSQAIQAMLDAATQRMDNLVVVRLAPDENAVCTLSGRRLTLPLNEKAQLAFCAGCAAAGLKVVLDLTGLRDGTHRLERAWVLTDRLPEGLIIRARDRYCPSLTQVQIIRPGNSRECARAVRLALNSVENCLILEDPLKAFEVCEVSQQELMPDSPISELLPQETDLSEGEPAAQISESAGGDVPADVPADEPTTVVNHAHCRMRHYDPSELFRTAQQLNIAPEMLAERCCRDLTEGVDVLLELDAQSGETSFSVPEHEGASLWIGRDRVALCWCGCMSREEAKALLQQITSVLELPARLLME